MSRPPKEGLIWALAGALGLPAVLFPVYNPDLFWHLAAGRWIFAHGRLPRVDVLTSSGAPWLDFEWLSQTAFYGAYAAAGLWGVWALKSLLLAGALWAFWSLLKALEVPWPVRPAALALAACVQLAYADARPDVFSLILLAWLLRRLELKNLGVLDTLVAFSLWSCLHGGFALGLIALALYAAAAWFSEQPALAAARAKCLAAGAAGALLNPYGAGAYAVVWRHWREQGELARSVKEWGPLGFDNPMYWPSWILLALLAAALLYRLRRRPERELSWALLGLTAYLAAASFQHARAVVYLGLVGSAALATLAPADGFGQGAAFAPLLVFLVSIAPRVAWRPPFNAKFVPVGAGAFLERERPAFEPLKTFSEWGYGGYLGFKLAPWFKPSSDGRYLFHARHGEELRALQTPQTWRAYSDANAFEAAVMPNLPKTFATSRKYPDGSFKAFRRPWYLSYFPRERWALVYWDAQALVFVDRAKADADWLAEREYRWVRPRDESAFADAVARGEVPMEEAAREETRHVQQLAAAVP